RGDRRAVHDRGELRDADPGDHTRRADRARPDADLDRVRSGVDQRLGGRAGGHITGHYVDVPVGLDLGNCLAYGPGMAVRRVDHDSVDASVDQRLSARQTFLPDADRRGDAQPAALVLGGVRVEAPLLNVLDGDQTLENEALVDDRQLLHLVLV